MKTLKKIVAVAGAAVMLLGTTSVSSAIDLRNEDARAYPTKVVSKTAERDLELKGRTMSIVVCVGECEFRVAGVGSTKAQGTDIVTIRNGRIFVERSTAAASDARSPSHTPR